jgi:ATPase, P-type (transporting), HAD superfamily, subfamily IC
MGVGVFCEGYMLGKGKNGQTVLAQNSKVLAEFYFEESIKASAREVLEYFKRMGIEVILVSGDDEERVKRVAKQLTLKNGLPKGTHRKSWKFWRSCRLRAIGLQWLETGQTMHPCSQRRTYPLPWVLAPMWQSFPPT